MDRERLKAIKKKELHCHLNGAIPLKVIFDIVQKFNIELPKDFSYPNDLFIKKRVQNMQAYFKPWALLRKLSVCKEAIDMMLLGVMQNLKEENIDYAEIRISPKTISDNNDISLETAILWLTDSLRLSIETTGIQARLIITIDRYGYNLEYANKLFKALCISNKDALIVGVDLAGDEMYELPPGANLFFCKCKEELGLGVTIHAGETGNHKNILDAIIEFKADRIGHGIALIKDLNLLEQIYKDDICIELCLQSNYLASNVESIEEHPVLKFINNKIPFVICSDNPEIHNFSLTDEYELFYKITKREDLLNSMYSIQNKYSFLPDN